MKFSKALGLALAVTFAGNATAEHFCKVKEEKVYCWGKNSHGQLGDDGKGGATVEANAVALDLGKDFAAAAAGAGAETSCAISKVGKVKCWGGNLFGQLGLEHGNTYARMGEKLPYVNFGKDEVATLMAVGADHICVALKSGGVKCWGHNDAGQLDVGDKTDRGGREGEMGDKLARAKRFGTKTISALQSASNADATCAKVEKATEWTCWGDENHFKRITK